MNCPECSGYLRKLFIRRDYNILDVRMLYCVNCDLVFKLYVIGEDTRKINIDNIENDEIEEIIEENEIQQIEYIKCLNCGKEFKPSTSRSKYCSIQCVYKHRKAKTKICLNCGKEFTPTHRGGKYCSYECFHLDRKKGLIKYERKSI